MLAVKNKWPALGWATLAVVAILAMGTMRIANASIMVSISGEVDVVDEEFIDSPIAVGYFFKATLLFDDSAIGALNNDKVDKPFMLFENALQLQELTYYNTAGVGIFTVKGTGLSDVTVKDEETSKDGVVKQKDEVKSKVAVSGETSVESGLAYEYVPAFVDITIDALGLSDYTLDALGALNPATFEGKVDLKFQAMNKDGTLAMTDNDKAVKSQKMKGKIIPVPEPSAVALLALGLLGLGLALRRREGSTA